MSRGFEPVCTNEEARAYFKNKGLTYDDIKEGDIGALMILLGQEYKKSNAAGETSVNTMYLSKKVDAKYKGDGSIINSNFAHPKHAKSQLYQGFQHRK